MDQNSIRGLCDLHTHTNFSPDAKSAPEEMCERAIELGLAKYAITDHCDVNFWERAEDDGVRDFDMYGSGEYAPASIAAQTALKEKYAGRLDLLCGIELGQPLQNIEKAEQIMADKRLDFIIGSHHQNAGQDDFYWIEYDKSDSYEIYALLEDYFTQMYEMCRRGGFDVLGHLTYPLRYICGEYGIQIDLRRFDDIIAEIFRTLIGGGMGIEINTSGLRQKYGRALPDLGFVKLYRELGGEIITLGSDAHCSADLGKGIAQGAEIARQAGFRYTAYFKARRAEFIKL